MRWAWVAAWAFALGLSALWVKLVPLGPVVVTLTSENGVHTGDIVALLPILAVFVLYSRRGYAKL